MMPYLFGLELTTPQTGFRQRERDLSMGRLVARLSFRRTARLQKQPEPDSTAARRNPGTINSRNCSGRADSHR
jgi:hypothetical protein